MRRSIITKIMISYAIILICTLSTTCYLYNRAVSSYVEGTYIETLHNDTERLIAIVSDTANYTQGKVKIKNALKIEKVLSRRLETNLKNMNTNYAVMNKFKRTIYYNSVDVFDEDFFENYMKNAIEKFCNKKGYDNVQVNVKGQVYNVCVTPITSDISPDIAGGWLIAYVTSTQSESLYDNMLWIMLLTTMISVAICVLFSYIMAKLFTKPIMIIKDGADRIAHYEFDTKLDVNRNDELGDLADSVNVIANELKKYDLNQKRFIQNASHELKTPLMSIQGYAEGVKDGVLKNTDSALAVIVDETQRLKRIVDSLILLTKLETSDDIYTMKPCSLFELFNNCIAKIDGAFLAAGKKLSLSCDDKDTPILCDSDKLTQAILNILSNCLRYATTAVDVKVVTYSDISRTQIFIRDDGAGFSDGEENKVFERFYKGNGGQVGLGLSITSTIIKRHHGWIKAYNNEDGGAEFLIELTTVPATKLK